MRPISKRLCPLACLAALGTLTVTAFGAAPSTVPMNVIPTFVPVGDGAVSTIIRGDQGVTITIHTKDLDPGPHTVTRAGLL